MKRELKLLAVVLGVLIALVAVVFSAFATALKFERAGAVPAATSPDAPAAACTKMTVEDVAWVTLNDDGEIDEQVESYPPGTTTIVPIFQYDCVPKKTTIVTIFSLDGETVFNDKEPLKASNSSGVYGYPLATTDDSPMDEGEWSVEFFNNKTRLTSGSVIVGEEGGGGETVSVVGVVKDAKTKKGIKGAVVLVLVPGVTVQDFIDNGQQDEDIFTAAKTDSKGKFELEDPLERGGTYGIIVVAKGYNPVAQDDFEIADDDPDPLELTVSLSK